MEITDEEIRQMQRSIRRLWGITACSLLIACGGMFALAMGILSFDRSDASPWEVNSRGQLFFDGDVWASNFVAMGTDGARQVTLGTGEGDGMDSGPGVWVYGVAGEQPVAAMWRESFGGRSRLHIGDKGTKPMEVVANGLQSLVIAPELLTYTEPVVRQD